MPEPTLLDFGDTKALSQNLSRDDSGIIDVGADLESALDTGIDCQIVQPGDQALQLDVLDGIDCLVAFEDLSDTLVKVACRVSGDVDP